MRKLLSISLLVLLFLLETAMAFFFNRVLDAQDLAKLINDLPSGSVSNRTIKRIKFENISLQSNTLEDLHFKSCKWEGVDAHEKTLKNIIFEDCDISNVNMRNAHLINVKFIESSLTNVVMNQARLEGVKFRKTKLVSTDPNIDNSYNGIQADEILFEDCDLNNIGFYRSKGIFRFEKSTLYDVAGQSLSEGSALYFHNTHASIINFDRSNLTAIEIIDSTIDKRSTAGGGTVKTIRVENSKLQFAISDNSNVERISFEDSGEVIVGGGKQVKETIVEKCPQGTATVLVGSVGFDLVEIDGCENLGSLFFGDSVGKKVIIKNSSAYDMDFRDSNIDHLVLENVKIHRKLKHQNTTINKLEVKNISFRKGVKVWDENSNIKITPDTWLEE